jgi:hypothetical protein
MFTSHHYLGFGRFIKTPRWKKKQRMWMKEWLKKRSHFSHENLLLRVLEISLLLYCRVYYGYSLPLLVNYWKCLTSFIQKGDMIIIYCCGKLHIKLYAVSILEKQPLMCKLLVHVWATSYKC